MTSRSLLAAFCAILSIAASLHADAQQIEPDAVTAPLCGMRTITRTDIDAALRRTREQDPALYRAMSAAVGKQKAHIDGAVGQEQMFWVLNNTTGSFQSKQAILSFEGHLCRIWVDVADTARLRPTSTTMRALARAIDTATSSRSRNPAQGILQNDIDVFGSTPRTFERDGKTDFFLFDIPDASVLGYFFPYDQEAETGSNQMNLLYIDSKEALATTSSLYNTIGHEFQHLIHYAYNKSSELFFNEGCSEVAGLLCGYVDRYNTDYFSNTNVDLLAFPTEGPEFITSYERAYTFMWFLYEQYGEAFLTQTVLSTTNGMSRLNAALVKAGFPATEHNAKLVLRHFAVANYLQTSDSLQYGYRTRITRSSSVRPKQLSTTTGSGYPQSGAIKLQRYGIAYTTYNSPGVLRILPTGTREFALMAMLYTGSNVEVRELTPGIVNILSTGGAGYDKIVLAYVNLTSIVNDITLNLISSTVGVDDAAESVAAAGSAIVEIAPMPAASGSTASAAIRTSGGSAVSLELYDTQGRLLRSYLDHQTFGAGEHRVALDLDGLDAGMYFLRMLDGEKMSMMRMVVR